MKQPKSKLVLQGYDQLLSGIQRLLEEARHQAARSVNAILTATYWEIGRRIVVHEQGGKSRAGYGEELIGKLSQDLTKKFVRGFSKRNLEQMRSFYLGWPIAQTLSAQSSSRKTGIQKPQTSSAKSVAALRGSDSEAFTAIFPLSWSHYVLLLSVKNDHARRFYEAEALRGGWSVRQLDRQVDSQFYERVALSRNKVEMLKKGGLKTATDRVTPEEEIKDPYVLEFLDLKDEYSESDLEEALIRHLETFLLELGGDFTFVARQKRLRVGDEWYRVDLVFFHRLLRCLVLVDLKVGKFTHADAGQMHMYLNYAREHWTHPEENPPVGLILCAKKNTSAAHYALDGLPNKVLAAEYKTTLPKENKLAEELNRTQRQLEFTVGKDAKN
jgi:predicted nuclease of restriction endonuclease-like (RecB) superfamily